MIAATNRDLGDASECTRLATGNQNRNNIEINGEKGSLKFDFERMNELQWWDHTLDPKLRGWSRIMCTDGSHPYAGHYWPAAHLIGYEHGFISQAADICVNNSPSSCGSLTLLLQVEQTSVPPSSLSNSSATRSRWPSSSAKNAPVWAKPRVAAIQAKSASWVGSKWVCWSSRY